MKLDEGKGVLPSWMGALCSFMLLFVMLWYSYYKVDIMLEKKSVDILSAINENGIKNEYIFGAKQGFNIAVGVA